MRQRVKTVFFIGLALIALFGMTACPNAAKAPEPTSPPEYTPVAYAKLADYLQKLPAGTTVHKIEVTGLTAENLKGEDSNPAKPSPLGAILQAHPAKKVALKLGGSIEGLTNMSYCFYGCTSLVGVTAIPKGVTNMKGCFQNCTSLMQAPAIPASVTEMSACFQNCTSLTKAPPAIPEGVTNMSQCFFGCTSLTKVPALPASVKDMSSCFASCTSLKEVPAIPEGVQNMNGCFYKCTSFTESPAIPEGVQDMRACFFGCTALKSVVLKCNYKDNQFQHTFSGCNLPDSSIKVPHGQLTAYTNHATEMGAQASWFAEE